MAENNSGLGGLGEKKQSGLSWSQPAQPTQSKPAMNPSGLGAMPAAMQKPAASAPATKSVSPVMRSAAPKSGNGSKIFGGFVGGLLVGGIAVALWFNSGTAAVGPDTTSSDTHTTNTTGTTQTTTGSTSVGQALLPSSSLSIASPQDAGSQVMVESATVSAPTWLVVYETSNGQPVRILGAAMVFPENNGKGATIPLLRATQSNQTYVVGERVDDGDHMLSLTNDKPVADSSGSAMWSTFKTK